LWYPCSTMSQVLRAYGMSLRAWSNQPYVWFAFHWLAISHTCYNPLIYFCMNTRYRAGFVSALRNVPGLGYLPARRIVDDLPGSIRPRAPSEVLVWQFRTRVGGADIYRMWYTIVPVPTYQYYDVARFPNINEKLRLA